MKKKTKILIYVITFIVVFLISALIRIMLLGSAPERLIKVEWDESVGEIYSNLDYEIDNENQYDLYIPVPGGAGGAGGNITLHKGTLQLLLIIRRRISARTHQSI